MVNQRKIEIVADLTNRFESCSSFIITEFDGLSVSQITQLRKSLGTDASYIVTKNTLAKIAAKNSEISGVDDFFTGSTAIAFVEGEIVNTAKALVNFAKENEKLVILGGYVDGNIIDENQVKMLATLESREVLLAKAAGAMKASLTKVAYLFVSPTSKMARALSALQEKK